MAGSDAVVAAQEEAELLLEEVSPTPGRRWGLGVKTAVLGVGALVVGSFLLVGTKPRGPAATSDELDIIEESLSNSAQDEILERHNIYRCMHGVSPLTWSNSIARGALSDVKENGFEHTSRENVGENLAWRSNGYSVDSVDDWYNEIEHTPNHKGKVTEWQGDPPIGHYTQVVWSDTKKIGCGYHDNVLTCQYQPQGNYLSQFSTKVKTLKKTWAQCAGGSNAENCKFPVEYNGRSMPGCTTDGHDEAWCYKEGGGWRACNAGDNACSFPFTYNNKRYTDRCATEGHHEPWCYKVGGGWKTC